MKRSAPEGDETEAQSSRKRLVTNSTFLKWQRDLNEELKTQTWLECQTRTEGGKRIVEKLKCKVCTRFQSSIQGRKNFSNKWIVGAESVCASNVRDHAQNNQHAHAMHLLKKDQAVAQGLGPSAYAPIARALTSLSDNERQRLRFKFDIAHFVATEKLS